MRTHHFDPCTKSATCGRALEYGIDILGVDVFVPMVSKNAIMVAQKLAGIAKAGRSKVP